MMTGQRHPASTRRLLTGATALLLAVQPAVDVAAQETLSDGQIVATPAAASPGGSSK